MQIYFAGSIRGGRKDAGLYRKFISYLRQFGTVCTEHVGDPLLTSAGDDGPTDRFIHDRDMAWLEKADVVVVDLDTPQAMPVHRAPSALVYNANTRDVDTAIVNGEIRLRHKEITFLDEKALLKRARQVCANLFERAGVRVE